MLKKHKLYLKSSVHNLKQGAHSPIMDLLPRRSQHWRQVSAWPDEKKVHTMVKPFAMGWLSLCVAQMQN
jgi:hypothetical protein